MSLLARHRMAWLGGGIAVLYTAWAVPFMTESSVLAFDGKRYYNLIDDAMISMRYAWNLAHGQGLVWNPGQRVEGYTNLLQTLIMSIFTAIFDKSSAVLAVQILGLLFVLGCIYLVWRLSGTLSPQMEPADRPIFTAAAVLMTLTYFPLSYWSLTGMETGVLTILVLGAVGLIEGFRRTGGEHYLLLAAAMLGLAYLSRPDSVILSVPLLAYALDLSVRRDSAAARGGSRVRPLLNMLPALGVFLAFPLGQEIFRILYYGAVLPNTYYLKVAGFPLADRIHNGLGFLSLYFWTHAVFLLGVLLGFALAPNRRRGYFLLAVVAPIVYEIWVGGDPARVWRFMVPVEPLAAILFVTGAIELLRRLRLPLSTKRGTALFGLATAVGILSVNSVFIPQIIFQQTWFPTNFYVPRVNAAVALNQLTTPEASIGVLAAGVVPYYTGRPAFDYLGRSDAHIASLPPDLSGAVAWNGMFSVPGHNKYDLVYSIEELQPTYTDTHFWGRQNLLDWVSLHYDSIDYHGVKLWLKKGAPEVKWELISP